jgi:uncharacterized protein (TIGR02172 family)
VKEGLWRKGRMIMQKGSIIGKGMTAEVYEWEQDKVLKLYYDWFPNEWVKYEADIGCKVNKTGVSSPVVYDIIDQEGRKGIIFQRITGKSMLRIIEAKPWKLFYVARQMAKLHIKIHSYSSNTLPSQNEKLEIAIKDAANILKDRETRILGYLESLPSGVSVCHGDFHPDNILVTEKDFITIDWTNAYSGNHLSDVARTCIMLRSPFLPNGSPKIMILLTKIFKHLLYSTYIKEYLRLGKAKKDDVVAWILPVAAARLREKVPGEEKWLLKIIDERLKL